MIDSLSTRKIPRLVREYAYSSETPSLGYDMDMSRACEHFEAALLACRNDDIPKDAILMAMWRTLCICIGCWAPRPRACWARAMGKWMPYIVARYAHQMREATKAHVYDFETGRRIE